MFFNMVFPVLLYVDNVITRNLSPRQPSPFFPWSYLKLDQLWMVESRTFLSLFKHCYNNFLWRHDCFTFHTTRRPIWRIMCNQTQKRFLSSVATICIIRAFLQLSSFLDPRSRHVLQKLSQRTERSRDFFFAFKRHFFLLRWQFSRLLGDRKTSSLFWTSLSLLCYCEPSFNPTRQKKKKAAALSCFIGSTSTWRTSWQVFSRFFSWN